MPYFDHSTANRFRIRFPFQSPISVLPGFRWATLELYWNNAGITCHLLWSENRVSTEWRQFYFLAIAHRKIQSHGAVIFAMGVFVRALECFIQNHLELLTRIPQPLVIFPLSALGMLSLSKIGNMPPALQRRHFEPEVAFIFQPKNCSRIVKQKWNIENKLSARKWFPPITRFSIFCSLFLASI